MPESEAIAVYGYLTQPEVRFLDAAVERLIPTDELGPGGRDAGVTCYIDRQLCSTWGTHGRNYRSGSVARRHAASRASSRASRRRRSIASASTRSTATAARSTSKPFDSAAPASSRTRC